MLSVYCATKVGKNNYLTKKVPVNRFFIVETNRYDRKRQRPPPGLYNKCTMKYGEEEINLETENPETSNVCFRLSVFVFPFFAVCLLNSPG